MTFSLRSCRSEVRIFSGAPFFTALLTPTRGIAMREVICTVSGQVAEAKSNTIRITNDRNSCLHSRDAADLLPHPGFVGNGILRSSEGVSGPVNDVRGQRSGIQGEAGQDGAATGGYGYRGAESEGRLTFPAKVQALVAVFALFIVGAAWAIFRLLVTALELIGKVSHLSGLWWLVGGAVAYGITCLIFYSILKIGSLSDQQVDEMGGQR